MNECSQPVLFWVGDKWECQWGGYRRHVSCGVRVSSGCAYFGMGWDGMGCVCVYSQDAFDRPAGPEATLEGRQGTH